jgi:hypothetical protein
MDVESRMRVSFALVLGGSGIWLRSCDEWIGKIRGWESEGRWN